MPVPHGLRIHGVRVTRRALILVVVLVIVALSYASTLRVYVQQQHDLAVANQQVADESARLASLQSQLASWNDPAYVEAQARDRLGWVMPGDTGYRVVDDNGKPVGGGAIDSQLTPAATGPATAWWDRLWGSVETADAPKPQATP